MVHPSPTILSSSVGTTAPEPLLVRYIREHVRKGEAAKERAAQNHKKSEDHFIAAGQYLTMLKVTYAPTWQHWEALLKIKVKLSTGRASELMQLASGKKDLQQIRDGKAQSVARLRASKSLHYSSEETIEATIGATIGSTAAPLKARVLALGPSDSKANANLLIDVLAGSDASTRSAAADALISGARQSQFELVTNAVADLYRKLAGAGR
jgi:hypothetical protein